VTAAPGLLSWGLSIPDDEGPPLTAIGPVWLREQQRKSALKDVLTKRVYQCANGWGIAARRGGRLHLCDETTWEIWTIDPRGVPAGERVGWVTDAQLDHAVERLARYWGADHLAPSAVLAGAA
jgi:hypothetical protein